MDTVDRIQELLEDRGIQQRQFCEAIGIKPQIYTDWKAGRNHSYKKYIDLIAEYLDVSADYLLGRKAQKKSSPKEDEKFNVVKLWMHGGSREIKLTGDQMELIAAIIDRIAPEN